MPIEDGYSLLRRVRAISATPVVAFTAYARPEDAERAAEAGFDGYLTKPLQPHELARVLFELLSRSRTVR